MRPAAAVFVDTSTWYAAASSGDRNNARAKELLRTHGVRTTSDHVVVETWRLLRHRLGWHAAERWWDALRTGVAAVETTTDVDMERARAIGEVFADQQFSLVDRTSFAVMERLRCVEVLAFDDDFAVYRFGSRRDRAFTVLR